MKAKKGFTLVEILIVVVILGILAAIVIPQFTNASTSAKDSSVRSDLQMFRSQIELYKLQHNEALPSAAAVGLTLAMTAGTDVLGAAGTDYGPYMQKLPTNPFNNLATIREEATTSATTTAGANTHGWVLCTTDGSFYPDYVDADGDGACDAAITTNY